MANLFGRKAKAPALMPVDGCAIQINDTIALTVNPAAGDVINFRLPAGIELGNLKIKCGDLDTGTGFLFRVGYTPCDTGSTLAADSVAFAPAGQTNAHTGTTLDCSFHPIKFEEDVYVTVTVNAASTGFTAGLISMIAIGSAIGPK